MNFTNPSYRCTPKRGEHGNTDSDLMKVEISAVMASAFADNTTPDPVIRIRRNGKQALYDQIYIKTEGAAGLEVDLGAQSCDGEWIEPAYFSAATDLTAEGIFEVLSVPTDVRDGDGTAANPGIPIEHELIVTLKGMVTEGDVFWVCAYGPNTGLPQRS